MKDFVKDAMNPDKVYVICAGIGLFNVMTVGEVHDLTEECRALVTEFAEKVFNDKIMIRAEKLLLLENIYAREPYSILHISVDVKDITQPIIDKIKNHEDLAGEDTHVHRSTTNAKASDRLKDESATPKKTTTKKTTKKTTT